jgi:hypothetical protein
VLFEHVLCFSAVTLLQVIEKGLALAKPRDCKSDDGVKVRRTRITFAPPPPSSDNAKRHCSSFVAQRPAAVAQRVQELGQAACGERALGEF